MSRQLKFRAWNGKSMEYGGFFIHATGGIDEISILSEVKDDSPVMQFTGLKDIKGNDIYEGDILEWAEVRATVEWCDSGAMYFLQEEYTHDMDYCESTLIVGNIHQNPEIGIGVITTK